jgi:hypothetical protein
MRFVRKHPWLTGDRCARLRSSTMDTPRVAFEALTWQPMAPGARNKVIERDAKRLRLVELTPVFVDPVWCLKGHIGYVVEGVLEIEFEARTERARAGDGLLIRAGAERHRAKAVSPVTRLVLVEDVSA